MKNVIGKIDPTKTLSNPSWHPTESQERCGVVTSPKLKNNWFIKGTTEELVGSLHPYGT